MSIADDAPPPSVAAAPLERAERLASCQAALRCAEERLGDAEERLRESEELFRRTFDQAAVGMVQVDLDGRFLRVNDRFCEIVGFRRDELLGRRFAEITHPDDATMGLVDGRIPLAENSEVVRLEKRYLHRQGRVVWVSVTTAMIHTRERVYTQALIEDITARKEAERVFRESEARAQAIIDHMLGGVVMADESYVIRSVNAAAARMFGYLQDDLVGRHLNAILPEFGDGGGDGSLVLGEVEPHVVGGVTDWMGRRRDGSVFPFELSLCNFQYGGHRYVAGNLRDLTELHEVERLKDELISTVNHELRTPITSIRGSLALLASGVLGDLPADAAEVIALADRNSLRLLTLINDMLDLERLERGKLEMERQPVDVLTLMERSRDVVSALADAEGVAIELHPTADAMIGDLDRLVQVLVNLLSNAVKFSPAGGAVSVSAVAVQETIEVRVKDRGRGVAAAHRELIFERFKQLEGSDTRHKAGTGLGLAISKSIVKQLGGQIGLDSEEGVGSVFWFRLPAAPAAAGAVVPEVPARQAGAGESA